MSNTNGNINSRLRFGETESLSTLAWNADRALNILVIASQLPYPPDNGGAIRLYHLYRRLRQKHHLTWVCPVWPGKEAYVQEAGRFCDQLVALPHGIGPALPERGGRRWLLRLVSRLHWERLSIYFFGYVKAPGLYWLIDSPERREIIDEVISSAQFDLVISEFEGNAELLPQGVDAPRVIVFHNVLSSLFTRIRKMYPISWEDRLFFWPELLKIIRYERKNYAHYDLGVAVSHEDRELLEKRCPNLKIEVIPNGVDASDFQPGLKSGEEKTLVYVGNYEYPPNADAILYFCRQILPLIRHRMPDVRLLAVGKGAPQELMRFEGVQLAGFVPDVRQSLAEADVVIAPLRVGGGTRLKIVEALGMGKAVVATTLGAEGLEVSHGRDILLADTPEGFADCVVRLLEQPELRARLGANGRRLVAQEYDWDVLAVKLESVLRQTVESYRANRSKNGTTHVMAWSKENA